MHSLTSFPIQGVQPLKGTFQSFRRWVYVPLRNGHTGMSHQPLNLKSISPSLAHASTEGVPERVYYELFPQLQDLPSPGMLVV